MPKQVPPSRRPERKLDETARAIAQAREAATTEKPDATSKTGRIDPSIQANRSGRGGGRRTEGGPAPMPSTKRPKQP